MGFRFRKSFKLLPGVRLNLSKTGLGASVGVPGARMTWLANGRKQRTLSLPGTGISHVTSTSGKKSARSNSRPEASSTDEVTIEAIQCGGCSNIYEVGAANFCPNCGNRL